MFRAFGMGSSDSDSNGAFSPFPLRGGLLIDRSIDNALARDVEFVDRLINHHQWGGEARRRQRYLVKPIFLSIS
jgi:hypothetical protein